MYFHEIAQELKLHMDPAGRAGEFVKRLVRDAIRDPMTDEEQQAEWLHEYNPMEKNISINMLDQILEGDKDKWISKARAARICKRVEEARCREENRQRKEQEIRLVKELVNKAEDYRIAKEIREYIQAMIDSGNEDITPEWIEWALKKADWYDPSIETEDEYLGKRQHEKSAEEKEKSLQDSIRKSWYW